MDDNGILHELSTDLLVGGSISGLMKYQNEDLVAARGEHMCAQRRTQLM